MTSPILQGQPDFNVRLASANIKLVRVSETLSAQKSYGAFYVGNTPFITLEFFCAVAMQVRFRFFGDSALAESVYDGFAAIDANVSDGVMCIPVRAPYVQFEVQRAAYPGDITLRSYGSFSRFNVHSRGGGTNSLISISNNTIGAGGNSIFRAVSVREGRARWSADGVSATNFVCYLIAAEFSGTTYILDHISSVNRGSDRTVFLPPVPVYAQCFNLDGVARDFDVWLSHHTFDY